MYGVDCPLRRTCSQRHPQISGSHFLLKITAIQLPQVMQFILEGTHEETAIPDGSFQHFPQGLAFLMGIPTHSYAL
jgi:hypothetical protein